MFFNRWVLLWLLPLWLLGCKTTGSKILVSDYQLLTVDSTLQDDNSVEKIIAPYREELSASMNKIIGHSRKRLTEKEVESLLGNFVSDAILDQSRLHYNGTIHLSVVNNSGLRAPIPEGPVTLSDIYELMPFENMLYIVELDGSLTLKLFEKLAKDKRLAVSNSVVIIQQDKPTRIFINGAPFKEDQRYVVAISDYLANGGGGMEFLKQAKILQKINVKIRDLIVDEIRLKESKGSPVDAEIEGRVQLIP